MFTVHHMYLPKAYICILGMDSNKLDRRCSKFPCHKLEKSCYKVARCETHCGHQSCEHNSDHFLHTGYQMQMVTLCFGGLYTVGLESYLNPYCYKQILFMLNTLMPMDINLHSFKTSENANWQPAVSVSICTVYINIYLGLFWNKMGSYSI